MPWAPIYAGTGSRYRIPETITGNTISSIWYQNSTIIPSISQYRQKYNGTVLSQISSNYPNITNTMHNFVTGTLVDIPMVWVDDPPCTPSMSPLRHRVEPQPRAPISESNERAKTLLFSQLTEEQRKTLIEEGFFIVQNKHSRANYRVNISHIVANVTRLSDGARLCAHCDTNLPLYDQFLAQKLMLEYDEETFLKIANRH